MLTGPFGVTLLLSPLAFITVYYSQLGFSLRDAGMQTTSPRFFFDYESSVQSGGAAQGAVWHRAFQKITPTTYADK